MYSNIVLIQFAHYNNLPIWVPMYYPVVYVSVLVVGSNLFFSKLEFNIPLGFQLPFKIKMMSAIYKFVH